MREGKEKGGKENGGFMRVEEKNFTEISKESSSTQKIKETDSLDNTGVTNGAKPIVNYEEEQNITVSTIKYWGIETIPSPTGTYFGLEVLKHFVS